MSKNFGKLLKDARASHGWTQRDVADKLEERGLKIDSSAITRLEKGQREPRLREAIEISELLDFSLDLVAAADLTEIGGESQFARNEELMKREMEAARRKIINACISQHIAFDGIWSDEEEISILARRGVSTAPEWMEMVCGQLNYAFTHDDPYGRSNYVMVTDGEHRRMLEKLVATITSNLFKTEDEVFESEEREKVAYRERRVYQAKEILEEALGAETFEKRFGAVFGNGDTEA